MNFERMKTWFSTVIFLTGGVEAGDGFWLGSDAWAEAVVLHEDFEDDALGSLNAPAGG